jgi:hypothetical protein
MTDGYIYCFSNPSMPGILKVGMTERTPKIRLDEANASDTWRPPTPYKIELAKKVYNASGKEKTLHILLEQYTYRIHPRREFFRVSSEEVLKFFDLIDGEIWVETNNKEEEKEEEKEDDMILELEQQIKTTNIKGCRDISRCFTNGQRIRHIIGINKIWIGIYDSSNNMIIHDDELYKSLSNFALCHNRTYNSLRMSTNGWAECECDVEGKWISTFSLPG